jgi:hypothetical protein
MSVDQKQSPPKLVWYASYGSNLKLKRFMCYIKGGIPEGSTKRCAGCHQDQTDPIDARPISLDFELYFAGRSEAWENGGVAFIREKPKLGLTLGRMYLITDEQFNDIVMQENSRTPDGSRFVPTFEELVSQRELSTQDNGWYGRILNIGSEGGYPILTITTARTDIRPNPNAPSATYVKIMASGLTETYPRMSSSEIVQYVSRADGLRGQIDPPIIQSWVQTASMGPTDTNLQRDPGDPPSAARSEKLPHNVFPAPSGKSADNISPTASGRLDAAILDDPFEAGRVNTARLIIRNPFDAPVQIIEILPPKSSTLRELQVAERAEKDANEARESHASKSIARFLSSFISGFFGSIGMRIGSAEITFGQPAESASKRIALEALENSTITFGQPLPPFNRLDIRALPGSNISIGGKNITADKNITDQIELVRIAPHCEVVQYFPFKTSNWLLFKPTKLNISVQMRYQVSSEERTQVVSASLDVKPPLSAMVIGSLIGSVLGTMARISTQPIGFNPQALFITFFSGVVMSLIATILLSRKTGAQGFITVEDFFGSFVVGTLIGYTGSSYFTSIISSQEAHGGTGH